MRLSKPGSGNKVLTTSIEPSGGASGQASDIAIHAKEILRVRENLTAMYSKHCQKSGESLDDGKRRFGMWLGSCSLSSQPFDAIPSSSETALERDYFMTAQEALEFGIIDEILENRRPPTNSDRTSGSN